MTKKDIQKTYSELTKQIEDLHKRSITSESLTAIMFCDLKGSTNYKSHRELVTSLIKIYRHNTEIQTQVKKFNGMVIKSLGDGLMATFQVNEPDDISMPVECSVRIQRRFHSMNQNLNDDEKILCCIGITCGSVVDFNALNPSGKLISDPQGPKVDLAARLCSLAKPQQILCDSKTANLVSDMPHNFNLSEGDKRELKGFSDDIEIFAVQWGNDADLSIAYPPPIYYPKSFLTTDFVLSKITESSSIIRVVGLSNRHFCDNIELYNLILNKIRENKSYHFELVFLNPFSKFKSYSELITRRQATDLKPDIIRNLKSACKLFNDIANNVHVVCSDYPMAIPLVQYDNTLCFSLPFRSVSSIGRKKGVVDGPFFQIPSDSELGKRIMYNFDMDQKIEVPIKKIVTDEIDLESILSLE